MKRMLFIMLALLISSQAFAQADRHEVRAGNRKFRRGDYKEAEIDYRKALLKDSLSLAGNYNLAGDLYRMERYDEAGKALETIKETAPDSKYSADYWYNKGAAELQCKNYSEAKKSFRESLLLRPDDMDAKENYSYAKKKEEEQQQQQNQNQDQNQDQNQNQDRQQNQDQNQDQQQDRNQDQQQNQDKQEEQQQQQQDRQELSAQQAQQMLKAVQAKEKETQDKVNEKKAALLESRRKDKNW